MSAADDVIHDPARLEAVRAMALSDPSCEPAFDRLTRLATQALHAPVSLVSLVAEDRQLFKGCIGLPEPWRSQRQTPLTHSFCQHCVTSGQPLIIADARRDPRVNTNLAIRDLNVIAYAGVPLITSEGHALGSFCVIDARPRKWTAQEIEMLRTLAGAAMTEIELRTALRAAQRERDENRAKDEFLAVVSHELRTPAGAILVWAKFLERCKPDDAKWRTAIENIAQSAKEQARLVDDLLDTSRILNDRLVIDAGPADLRRAARSAAETLRPAAELARITLDVAFGACDSSDDKPLVVAGDEHRLRQVVTNLLDNAIKFTPAGGRVRGTLRRGADGHAVLEISDTGAGIAPEFLPHVFERFRQADSTSTRHHGGLGLGLTIVRRIVELHGGTIEARSAGAGQGATFIVSLPLAAGDVATAATTGDAGAVAAACEATRGLPVSLAGLRVLIVEDSASTREALVAAVEGFGATVVGAPSAVEGLRQLKRGRPHVLVSDIAMPDEDGYALIRRVRALPARQGGGTPAVALTAHAGAEHRRRALAAGFDAYRAKPTDPQELARVIASLVDARKGPQRTAHPAELTPEPRPQKRHRARTA